MSVASTAFHATLLKTLKDVSFGEARTLLAPLVAQGVLDMSKPLPALGSSTETRPFFTLWFAQATDEGVHHLPRSLSEWNQVQQWAPSPDWWLDNTGPHRPSLFNKWLESHAGSGLTDEGATILCEAGPKAWDSWTSNRWYKLPSPARLAAHLMALQHEHGGVDAVLSLVEKGVSWTAQWKTEFGIELLASHIKTPAQWASFLRHGGDPEKPVSSDASSSVPLWQALTRDVQVSDLLKKAITTSLADRVPGAGQQAEQDDIDRLFEGQKTNLTNRARITALAAKQNKDWTQLRDSRGQHVLMPWLQHGRNAEFKDLASSNKSHRLLNETDHQGRNAWPFLLSSDNPAPDVQAILLTAKVPLVLDKQGRGLLFQLERKDDEGFPAPSSWHKNKLSPKSDAFLAHASAWLTASDTETEAYVDHRIQHKKYPSPTSATGEANTFSHLAHLWTRDDQDIGPRWRAAVCINELFTENPDWTWLGEQIGKGVTLNWSPDRSEQLMAQVGPPTPTGNTKNGVSADRYDRTVAVIRLLKASALIPESTPEAPNERRRSRLRT